MNSEPGPVRFSRTLGQLLAITVLFLAGSSRAQKGFEAQGFQAADYYGPPHETQMKSFLQGAQARPLDNGLLLLIEALLKTFRETGEHELTVRAPECFYDRTNRTASSAGPMHAETADGKFSIEGEGFLWWQTNSSLFISNRVHTVVQSELLSSPADRQASNKPESASPLDIFSDKFDYTSTSGKAVYRNNAHVNGTNLDLVGSILTLDLPQAAPGKPAELKSILVETNIVLNYTNYSGTNVTALRATGQHAFYAATTGRLRVTGQPEWTAEGRAGRGDELLLDRTNKIFNANGHAFLQLPGQSLGAGLLTRSNATDAVAATNRFVDIFSESYELRTNWGVFRENVRVSERLGEQQRGKMACNWMTVSFAGTNELQQLVALTNVVIEQDTNRFTAGKAVYTGTNGVLDLTEKPTWQSGPRSGKGNLIRVRTEPDEMYVKGNASVRLPAKELGEPLTQGSAPPSKPRTKGETDQFADVFCEEYTLRQDSAVFRGGVYASHTNMNWACESLIVESIPGGKVLTAEQGVVFDLIDEHGQKFHGTGNKAIYTNSIVGSVTNDLLTLFGTPAKKAVLTSSTNATFENPVIIFDRVSGNITGPGPEFRITGTNAVANTNLFLSPQHKPKP
jgi:lipopolysaccharide export system protein LptA